MSVPSELNQHILPFHWEVELVWKLKAPTQLAPRERFDYLLALPLWASQPRKGMLFDLRPLDVLADAQRAPHQHERMIACDTSYPLDFLEYRGRLWTLDGVHRLAKLYSESVTQIHYRVHDKGARSKIERPR